ncbi:MAG: ethanolamine utilization protein EutH, partial [Clostridia bacterium]|nr:ethanolamine utilization protein EutH [Clostridia bacterium]
MKDMDPRGQTMNAAFSVCAASALAAHLGFTLSAEPQMLLPLLLTKFFGGMLAAILAVAFTKRDNAISCK